MLCTCSARLRTVLANGEWKEYVTLGIMMEQTSKDVVCVNIIGRREFSSDGAVQGCDETIACSCDIMRVNGILCDSKCIHRKYIIENDEFMRSVRKRIGEGFSGNIEERACSEVHGTWITQNGGSIKVGEEAEDNFLCTQLEQLKGKSLTRRGKEIERIWIFWTVFDVDEVLFVCCVRKAVGSGIAVTKMNCVQCSLGTERKYRHEVGCLKQLREAGNVNINDSGDLLEVVTACYHLQ